MSRTDAVVAVQQLLELDDEFRYFFGSTQDMWEYSLSQRDRRQRERRWQDLRPVVVDLGRLEKISEAMLECLAAWPRVSVGVLNACVDIAMRSSGATRSSPTPC